MDIPTWSSGEPLLSAEGRHLVPRTDLRANRVGGRSSDRWNRRRFLLVPPSVSPVAKRVIQSKKSSDWLLDFTFSAQPTAKAEDSTVVPQKSRTRRGRCGAPCRCGIRRPREQKVGPRLPWQIRSATSGFHPSGAGSASARALSVSRLSRSRDSASVVPCPSARSRVRRRSEAARPPFSGR